MDKKKFFRTLCRWYLFFMLAGSIILSMSTPAFADAPLITGNVTAGTLTETASAGYSFSGAIGSTASFTMPFSASDLTGSAAGWHITLNTSQFLWTGHSPFPTTAITMTNITAACTTASTCSSSPLTTGGTLALTAGTGLTIFSAPVTVSSGVFTLTPSFTVAIPGNASITTGGVNVYTSTFTLGVVSGP